MTLWPSETMIENERPAKKLKHVNSYQESDAMPSVITTGDGTITGKRTVCIVCVCHGSFPSPTEFVMHAGGKEVADPMKHITVCSDSFGINGDGAAFITHPFQNVQKQLTPLLDCVEAAKHPYSFAKLVPYPWF